MTGKGMRANRKKSCKRITRNIDEKKKIGERKSRKEGRNKGKQIKKQIE